MKFFKLKRARSLGGLLAGLGVLVAALVATAGGALAAQVPASNGGGFVYYQPPVVVQAAGGMPGWQIALIAVGAALVAAVLAVLADRTWSARGRLGTPASRA